MVIYPSVHVPANSADRWVSTARDAGSRSILASQQRTAPADAGASPARVSMRRASRVTIEAVRRSAVERPSRGADRRPARVEPPPWLQQCLTGREQQAKEHPNGAVPTADLCRLPGGNHLLHGNAALGWWRLNRAFIQRFGTPICITDSYRSYAEQAHLYAVKPGLAAAPGTSNHGWGVAVDLCGGVESYSSPAHKWLGRYGARYGWVNPPWAQQSGTLPEPWHWEYVGR